LAGKIAIAETPWLTVWPRLYHCCLSFSALFP
jgi:hypothetical protein